MFHDIAWFECFTDLNLLNIHSMSFDGAYFLLAAMVRGDESSQLSKANKPAVLAEYQPLFNSPENLPSLVDSSSFLEVKASCSSFSRSAD